MLFPVYQPFSGTVDVNGNCAVLISGINTAHWSLVFATVEQDKNLNGVLTAVGNPFWSMQIDQSKAAFATGASAEVGPRLVPPKSTVTINLTGGIPGAIVNGILQGSYSTLPNASELMANYTPSINPIAITTPGPLVQFQKAALLPNGSSAVNVPVPANIRALAFIPTSSPNIMAVSSIIGNQTNAIYFNDTSHTGQGQFINEYTVIPFSLDPTNMDTTVAITMNNNGITSHNMYIIALTDVQTTATGPIVNTTSALSTPAPWQSPSKTAPFSINLTAGTPVVIITALAGLIVYVHAIFINTNIQANVFVEDTTAAIFARGAGAANQIALNTDLKGFQLVSGRGVQLDVSVNAGLNGVIAYSQV